MCGTQQELARAVKHVIGLPVKLHRYVCTAVQVRVRLTFEAHRKSPHCLARVHHIKGYGQAAFSQFGRAAKRLQAVAFKRDLPRFIH